MQPTLVRAATYLEKRLKMARFDAPQKPTAKADNVN
jgi:hypothetical protein